MRAALFATERVTHGPLSRCRALVPLPRQVCLRCGGPLRRERISQPALFRHGGYGATREQTFVLCQDQECRWVRLAVTVEVSPRHRAVAVTPPDLEETK